MPRKVKVNNSRKWLCAVGMAVLIVSFFVVAGTWISLAQTETQILAVRVASSSDDAEEHKDGSVSVTSTDLELVYDDYFDSNQYVGMRFKNIAVPQGATIAGATIQFQVDENRNTDKAGLVINGQASDDAPAFSANVGDVSNRKTTSASVSWSPSRWEKVGGAGADQRTPDTSAIIQEIINRPGWESGNDLVIVISGTGVRIAESYDGNPSGAPLLEIAWEAEGSAPSPQPANIAPAVNAGDDATITLPANIATLDGTVTDDGLPAGSVLAASWEKVSGPGTVTFGNNTAVDTTATFSTAGTYILRLTATDGELSGSDTASVVVREETVTLPNDAFTIVALPDTQLYSLYYPDTFTGQAQWIAKNKSQERIVFVTHEGDVVSEGGQHEYEWQRADAAIDLLDGVVPYSVVIGNHDYERVNDVSSGTNHFVSYFGKSRYSSYGWYGGASANNLNHYQVFQAGGRTFLHFGLELEADDAALAWAQGIINANPGLPTIVTTHSYQSDARGRTQSAEFGGNSGEQIWKKLIAANPQIFMVLNGHFHESDGEQHQISTNNAGLPVVEIVANYQSYSNGGDGYLRLMRFVPSADEIQVRTYSPKLDSFIEDNDSRFTLSLDFDSRFSNIPSPQPANTAPAVNAGADATITLPANIATLDGTVTDDGLPAGSVLAASWEKVSGPGTVTFGNNTAVDTTATFSTAGTYILRLTATDGELSGSDTITVTILEASSSDLPAPWMNADIGPVNIAGSASYADGAFYMKASGSDIWKREDLFHFVYQPWSGDGEIIARVQDVFDTNEWAKAGVMIRENLSAGSRHAMMVVTPRKGVAFQRRIVTGGDSYHTGTSGVAPQWVKLVREGDTISSYVSSSDGSAWTLVGMDTVLMNREVYLGLALTAHNNALLTSSTISGVSVALPNSGGNQQVSNVLQLRIASSSDDAEELNNGKMYTNSTDLELVYDDYFSSNQYIGMRFANVIIPKGATIKNASIQFQVDENRNSDVANLVLRGQAVDDATSFTTESYNVSSRPTTQSSVSWSPPRWDRIGDAGPNQRTVNLSSILQEIISRPGWQSGSNLAIIITGTGVRIAESYEGDRNAAPLLEVEWEKIQ